MSHARCFSRRSRSPRLGVADGALISARLVSLRPCSVHGALRADASIAQGCARTNAENQRD
jgi:hypothetical protein